MNMEEYLLELETYVSGAIDVCKRPNNITHYFGKYKKISNVDSFGWYFDDECKWSRNVPSKPALVNLYEFYSQQSADLQTRSFVKITGDVFSADHTFKIAKSPTMDSSQLFDGFYSVMNELGQILGYWMTCTQSMKEIAPYLEKVFQFCNFFMNVNAHSSVDSRPLCPDWENRPSVFYCRRLLSQSRGLGQDF